MSNLTDFDKRTYFMNTDFIIDSILAVQSFGGNDNRLIKLALSDAEKTIHKAKKEITMFCLTEHTLIEEGYKYLTERTNDAEKLLSENELILKDERKELLSTIREAINSQFTGKTFSTVTTNKKIKWTGTPAEFGAIFSALIDGGYIEVPPNKTQQRKILQQFFTVTTNSNEPIAERTLDDYLGRNKKSWPKGQFAIPISENYNTLTE